MTLGEDRVRAEFNPAEMEGIDLIKQKTAQLIDMCNQNALTNKHSEENRLWSLAMTSYEQAVMWAVKAATYDSYKRKPKAQPEYPQAHPAPGDLGSVPG